MKKFLIFPVFLVLITELWSQCREGNCYDGYGVYYYSNGPRYEGNWMGINTMKYTNNAQTPTLNGSGYDPEMPLSIVRSN